MGVDIKAIVKHSMTAKELLSFPSKIDFWDEIKNLKQDDDYMLSKKAKWNCNNEMTEEILLMIWANQEANEFPPINLHGYVNVIECFIGWINVYPNALTISQFPEHKYANIYYPDTAKKLITINRIIANKVGSQEIIYCPDSAYGTAIIDDYPREGINFDEIKKRAIETFGTPPSSIEEGRKYMFFIDNIHEEIGEITKWEDEHVEWVFNEKTGKYDYERYKY